VYFGENEVTLSSKMNNKRIECYSNKLVTILNLEKNELSHRIDINTFLKESDTLCFYKIFNEQSCPSLYTVLIFPFNKLDKDISGKQIMTLNGNLYYCNRAFPIIVSYEFEYLDKLLLFDFSLNIDASVLELVLPKGMDNIIQMHVDNGKVIVRKN